MEQVNGAPPWYYYRRQTSAGGDEGGGGHDDRRFGGFEILVVSFLWLTQKGTQVSGSSSIAICGETAWMKAEETMG